MAGRGQPSPRRAPSGGMGRGRAPTTSARLPVACTWYNNRHKGCSKGHTCTFLHVCQFYLKGDCRFGAQRCAFSHNLHDSQPMGVLSDFGIDVSQPESFLLEMYRFNVVSAGATSPRSAQLTAMPAARRRTPSGGGGSAGQGDDGTGQGTEICTFNLRSRCSFANTCHNWHCAMPYQWQYRHPGNESWKNYTDDLNIFIEKHFCDVSKEDCEFDLNMNQYVLNFKDMKTRSPQGPSSLFQRLSLRWNTGTAVEIETEVRRLTTPSWGAKPAGYPFVTEWRWYWQDVDGTWVEYGQMNSSGADRGQSSLTSQDIEERYQDQPDAELSFSTQHHQYVLRLRDMQQENVVYKTRRDVRRRPRFVSEDDVINPRRDPSDSLVTKPIIAPESYILSANICGEDVGLGSYNRFGNQATRPMPGRCPVLTRAGCDGVPKGFEATIRHTEDGDAAFGATCRQPASPPEVEVGESANKPTARRRLTSGSSGVDDSLPAHWLAMAEDGDDYDEVPLSPSGPTAGEYQQVKALFEQQGMAGTPIGNIKRVQNPYLWSAYVRKKAQMKKQSGGTDPEERQLFHGTRPEAVDAICLQNFDWRLSGTSTGATYGQGSYFSTNSKYSNDYAQQATPGRKTMFVAKVLVGAYTRGQSSLRRPPPLNPAEPLGKTFDSCVNSRSDPKIFVIFDSAQCYPEYLIEY
ncbi:Poly (ADP-ribose) polymerase [Branchiostoma belcheri]|nr:Poly (ADP-ribose) polymerase [Branchiostoma belcheri]